jgi:hypothetical protein
MPDMENDEFVSRDSIENKVWLARHRYSAVAGVVNKPTEFWEITQDSIEDLSAART